MNIGIDIVMSRSHRNKGVTTDEVFEEQCFLLSWTFSSLRRFTLGLGKKIDSIDLGQISFQFCNIDS